MGKLSLKEAILDAEKSGRAPVIVDIKPVSPRNGDLMKNRTPADLANMAETTGACAVSVVTEPLHFGGSIEMLAQVAENCDLPVLQKDFFRKSGQVDESHQAGASAFLIILGSVTDQTAGMLLKKGRTLGMEAVVEVHTEKELKRALKLDPDIIGINNRDISRLELDAGDVRVTEKLAPMIPGGIVTISESALQTLEDVQRAFGAGANAALIGTAILTASDLQSMLADLISSGSGLA